MYEQVVRTMYVHTYSGVQYSTYVLLWYPSVDRNCRLTEDSQPESKFPFIFCQPLHHLGTMDSNNDVRLLPRQNVKGTKTRHAASSVRHAEKRRTSTCRFADRIAQFCVDHYIENVPAFFRDQQKQTCMAAIVAFVDCNARENGAGALGSNKLESVVTITEVDSSADVGRFFMLGLGVGTKFLSTEVLEEETKYQHDAGTKSPSYGAIVRDCHAEVLARRAFRRQLLLSILQDTDSQAEGESPPILQRVSLSSDTICYGLRPGVSLHMYTSSAPCGNATVSS